MRALASFVALLAAVLLLPAGAQPTLADPGPGTTGKLWSLAFVDNFRLITVLSVCSVPLVLLLKRVRARATPGAH